MQETWQQDDSNIIDSPPLWLVQYKVPLIAGLLLVLAGAVGFASWQARKSFRESLASAELGSATTVETRLEIAQKYLGTDAAAIALLSVSSQQYEKADYAGSAKTYDLFLANYPKSSLTNLAHLGRAWAEESAGNVDAALNDFTAVGTHVPADNYNPIGLIESARLYKNAKNITAARQALNNCVQGFANTFYARQAAERLTELPSL